MLGLATQRGRCRGAGTVATLGDGIIDFKIGDTVVYGGLMNHGHDKDDTASIYAMLEKWLGSGSDVQLGILGWSPILKFII